MFASIRMIGAVALLSLCPLMWAGDGETDDPYAAVAHGRAEKIVAKMDLAPSQSAEVVIGLIADQYRALNRVHEARDQSLAALKEHAGEHPAMATAAREAIERTAADEVWTLHVAFIGKLNAYLDSAQVDAVKNGMTYGRMPRDLAAYHAMLPDLTAEQRLQIYAWYWEAREYAMTGGSSEEKHGYFDRYKGRITNYLSKAGYDLKAAEKVWLEREKAKSAK